MATANELLLSSSVRHMHHLEGYKRLLAQEAWVMLQESYRDAISRLAFITDASSAPGRQLREVMTRQQVEQYVQWADQTLAQGYDEFERWFTTEMQDFSQFEAQWQAASIRSAANGRVMPEDRGDVDIDDIPEPSPRGVVVALAVGAPTAQELWVAVSTRPFGGTTLEESFQKLDTDARNRYERAIRQSWIEGWTLQQTMQSLRGTARNNYRDGIAGQSQREQETFVRTGTNHVATTSRHLTYDQNEDIITGWRFVATLDGKTSLECQGLDGTRWALNEGPRPPRHPRCRSSDVCELKSWQELGFAIQEPEMGTRPAFAPAPSMGLSARASSAQVTEQLRRQGYSPDEIRDIKRRFSKQVPEKQTYGEFLRNQEAAFQDEVLRGKAKGKLFRDGKLPIDRFTDNMGRNRNLAELKRLYPDAWKRAGLPE